MVVEIHDQSENILGLFESDRKNELQELIFILRDKFEIALYCRHALVICVKEAESPKTATYCFCDLSAI